ncbi:factor associated with metabolism and energy [Tenrec ecaudatus]|uniref:factor associated with metabolism and energy n=1 Tax=Tenrec ecaudatus TaxID=94439 RepID=UPI003F5A06E0
MGLNHSKAHPRVIRVAPRQDKGEASSVCSVDFASNRNLEENSSYSFPRPQDQPRAVEGQLPPLRETWYGRHSAVPRAMYFDIPLEQRETSIIKRHPPRRLQVLESSDLPQVITSVKFLSQQEARTTHKAKELEKKMQIPSYISGKRQYLHKMQMLEMNRKRQEAQLELKKDFRREAIINKQNSREHKAKKILQSLPRNEDDDLTWVPDETVNRNPGNSWNATFLEHQAGGDYCRRKIGKMETWLREQETRGQLFWDTSSSDSDEPGRDEKKPRALVRTRTEKIPLFDEFFDQE